LLKETVGVFDIDRLYMYVDSKCTDYAIPNQRKFTVKTTYKYDTEYTPMLTFTNTLLSGKD